MPSYRQILYHLVFTTKNRDKSLDLEASRELYAYILGIIRNKNGCLYRVNGMEDHIHILCDLHPSVALADFVREIKTSTSVWLKKSGKFPKFTGWSTGYGAFTCWWKERERVINYIKNQRRHHGAVSYESELRELLVEHDVVFDEKYFP